MLRAATTSDLVRLNELVREMHGRSIYKGVKLNESAMRSWLLDGVRRHGGKHAGATLFNVVEFRGRIEAFMLGLLQPLYLICDKLEAMDFWLYATPKAPGIAASRLIEAYTDWATSNPAVHEVKLSWTDALQVNGGKLGKLYQRKGYDRIGEIYRKAS